MNITLNTPALQLRLLLNAAVAMQVAYLASSLFLDCNSDLIVLVVNTLQRDLKSDNYIIGMTLQLSCEDFCIDLHLTEVLQYLLGPAEYRFLQPHARHMAYIFLLQLLAAGTSCPANSVPS